MKFYTVSSIIKAIYPSFIWNKSRKEHKLFLTFDDGPVPGPTNFVIKHLKKHNAKATFFCVGDNILKNPDLFDLLNKEGHAIGNHTLHHMNGRKSKLSHYLENINFCEETIILRKGNSHKFFRPPYGRMTLKQITEIKKIYNIIMWDVLTYDFSPDISPEVCLEKAIRNTRPGSIIVFHDSYKAFPRLNYVLPRYIEYFTNKGYQFSTL